MNVIRVVQNTAPNTSIPAELEDMITKTYAADDQARRAAMSIAQLITDWARTDGNVALTGKMGDLHAFKLIVKGTIESRTDLLFLMKHPLVVEIEISIYANYVVLMLLYAETEKDAAVMRAELKYETYARITGSIEIPSNAMITIPAKKAQAGKKLLHKLLVTPMVMVEPNSIEFIDYPTSDKPHEISYWGFRYSQKEGTVLPIDDPLADPPLISKFYGSKLVEILDKSYVVDIYFAGSMFKNPPPEHKGMFTILFNTPPLLTRQPERTESKRPTKKLRNE